VTVVSKDQNASGDLGVYDMKTKTITLTGNVVVSQARTCGGVSKFCSGNSAPERTNL
jgi:lipopolysaccharide export system protein LptA